MVQDGAGGKRGGAADGPNRSVAIRLRDRHDHAQTLRVGQQIHFHGYRRGKGLCRLLLSAY